MPFHQVAAIRYYTFESLAHPGITQAVFTRRGGVSPAPWDSLNVGGYLGDDLEHTYQNRALSFQAVGREPASVYDVWQVHSDQVICADAPRRAPHLQADAILTDSPAVTLFMRFADCVPIFLHDPVRGVVGLAHAGWQGTVKGIARLAVEAMQARYGSRPADIRAGIGPSIGAHHYTVGAEVIARARASFGEAAATFLPEADGAVQFDLWAANRFLLEQAGVFRVEVSGLCTACHPEDWFSHRAQKGHTGRFGALLALNG